jgi:hypothetical protein
VDIFESRFELSWDPCLDQEVVFGGRAKDYRQNSDDVNERHELRWVLENTSTGPV